MAYEIVLPPHLAQIHKISHLSHLRKYVSDPSHILEFDLVQMKENLSFEVKPIKIIDSQVDESLTDRASTKLAQYSRRMTRILT